MWRESAKEAPRPPAALAESSGTAVVSALVTPQGPHPAPQRGRRAGSLCPPIREEPGDRGCSPR